MFGKGYKCIRNAVLGDLYNVEPILIVGGIFHAWCFLLLLDSIYIDNNLALTKYIT